MPAMESPERPAAKTPGRLSQALLRLLMTRATVVASAPLAERFRLVTLESATFEGTAWIPGQKLQIAMGSAFVARTYTPIDWDAAAGRTRILGYAHGDGPGSAWLLGLKPGDACDLFGPRGSLDVNRTAGPLAVFGDETSIGLAHALIHRDRTPALACHFEVGDIEGCRRVTAKLGLDDAVLFERRDDEAHLDAMKAALPALAETGATFVLTGRAYMIQQLRQGLIRQAFPAARILAKAYWAPGKKGMD
jgi:NADPH-dependent ferric siderophore reductase